MQCIVVIWVIICSYSYDFFFFVDCSVEEVKKKVSSYILWESFKEYC